MRIDDTHDIIRSVYFNFGASQPPTRMRSANTHTHNANISAVMSFHAVKPNKEEMLKGKWENRVVDSTQKKQLARSTCFGISIRVNVEGFLWPMQYVRMLVDRCSKLR